MLNDGSSFRCVSINFFLFVHLHTVSIDFYFYAITIKTRFVSSFAAIGTEHTTDSKVHDVNYIKHIIWLAVRWKTSKNHFNGATSGQQWKQPNLERLP